MPKAARATISCLERGHLSVSQVVAFRACAAASAKGALRSLHRKLERERRVEREKARRAKEKVEKLTL